MGGEAAFFTALLAKHEPCVVVVRLEVAHAHADQRTDSHEAVEHDREQGAIAPRNETVQSLERLEEPARLLAVEHGRFAFISRKPGATDGRRRIEA